NAVCTARVSIATRRKGTETRDKRPRDVIAWSSSRLRIPRPFCAVQAVLSQELAPDVRFPEAGRYDETPQTLTVVTYLTIAGSPWNTVWPRDPIPGLQRSDWQTRAAYECGTTLRVVIQRAA